MEKSSNSGKINVKPVWYTKNSIVQKVHTKAVNLQKDPMAFEQEFREAMKSQLGITNRLSAILNNTFPPSLEEIVPMAGWLGVSVDELIVTSNDTQK